MSSAVSAAPASSTDRSVIEPARGMDRRTSALLEAPLLPLLLRLAVPNILLMLAQSATGLIETYFIGKLGTDALAGAAVVFPGLMLMQMISAGSMGGGISSSVARTLGSGRREDASHLVWHAVVINGTLGLVCSAAMLSFGPSIYRAMGAEGPSLDAALAYSNVIYAGAVLLWIMNALASIIRGTGNMVVPGGVICGGALLLIPLSPCLIFGVGPFPRLGVAGGATALLVYYVLGITLLAGFLCSGRAVMRPAWPARLRKRLFGAILSVGAPASTTSIQTNLTIIITTAIVGVFGPAALAGFATGSRLEYLMVPISFGVGGPLVAIVGTNIGAGQKHRALKAAWLGGAVGFCLTESIGVAAAIHPIAWLSLFGSDPAMLSVGAHYLHIVGPFYGVFGLGLVLYFACQGAGRLVWPITAQFCRLVLAAGGGNLAIWLGFGLTSVFWIIGLALGAFGAVVAGSILLGGWGARQT
ncbi:MAG TPA: MATE family efflux transporter [Rhodopila sp.]|uniref:MATE family efflux transporter n=1 Tax=Rhodopila sp. TaxID=2480087 RepID=UPI002C07ACCC|nr:MATE family efflux transporter [Rhodopila sp.]HVY13803.1 MATE family efflux transporter [Rhodopila sp.]